MRSFKHNIKHFLGFKDNKHYNIIMSKYIEEEQYNNYFKDRILKKEKDHQTLESILCNLMYLISVINKLDEFTSVEPQLNKLIISIENVINTQPLY